jgi:hypothetical protein
MLDPDYQKTFTAELDASGLETVKAEFEAGVFGQPSSNERAMFVRRWIMLKEREDSERWQASESAVAREANAIAREANALASAANAISERAERRAKNANTIAIIAAIIAVASVIFPILIERLKPSPAVPASPSAASSSQP